MVGKWKEGDTVGVGCFVDSCRKCEACKDGEEQFCDEGMTATYNGYERDGKTPTYGGYSTRITVNERLRTAHPLLECRLNALLTFVRRHHHYSPLNHFGVKPGAVSLL